jgi:Amt family ammonium transporter
MIVVLLLTWAYAVTGCSFATVINADIAGPFSLLSGVNSTQIERCPFSYATLATAQAACSARVDCSAVEEQAGLVVCGIDDRFELRGNGPLAVSPGLTAYIKDATCTATGNASRQDTLPQAGLEAVMLELDGLWYFVGTVFVFLMQTGFTLLEMGFVSIKNTKNILIKNVYNSCLAAMAWLLIGSSISSGGGPFIGRLEVFQLPNLLDDAADTGDKRSQGAAISAASWLFGWAFACNASSIISGACAERIKYEAFMVVCFFLLCFIYPCCAHWVWSTGGWAVMGAPMGVIDFAGSGVVHMVGGTAALVTTMFLGPRDGRFEPRGGEGGFGVNPFGVQGDDGDGNDDEGFAMCTAPLPGMHPGTCMRQQEPRDMPRQSTAFQTMGTMLMWVGWYGFNACSTLPVTGASAGVILKAAYNTTICPAAAALTALVLARLLKEPLKPEELNSSILGGLVAITAGCSVVSSGAAVVIGVVASALRRLGTRSLLRLGIDDVVDAVPVHLVCGAWGVISVGFFADAGAVAVVYRSQLAKARLGDGVTAEAVAAALPDAATAPCGMLTAGCEGRPLMPAQILFTLAVLLWTGMWSVLLCGVLKSYDFLRETDDTQEIGMDISRHDGEAYQIHQIQSIVTAGLAMGGPVLTPPRMPPVPRALAVSRAGSERGGGGGSGACESGGPESGSESPGPESESEAESRPVVARTCNELTQLVLTLTREQDEEEEEEEEEDLGGV